VVTVPNGRWKQNCFVVVDDESRDTLIIDPGSDVGAISEAISEATGRPVAIVNTHAHYDHIGAVDALMKAHGLPFFLHKADAKLLTQANLYKILFESRESVVIPVVTNDLSGMTCVTVGTFSLGIVPTPGHTMGSVCLRIGNNLFSGDTLLSNGPGRTDLPGGSKQALAHSIQILRGLPAETVVWPGHGRSFELSGLWSRLEQANSADASASKTMGAT
jgi:glyoxylase-like metal-dependent hydrolase (beta-lactamase superfamily II)